MTTVEREAVAWCKGCEMYLPAEDAGTKCPGDDCGRKLRRRVGRICRQCELHPVFLVDIEGNDGYDRHVREAHGGSES